MIKLILVGGNDTWWYPQPENHKGKSRIFFGEPKITYESPKNAGSHFNSKNIHFG